MLNDLTRTAGWKELQALSHQAMEPTKRAVLNGSPKDIEEYRKKTGWLNGIHHVLDLPSIMWDNLEAERAQRVAAGAPLT